MRLAQHAIYRALRPRWLVALALLAVTATAGAQVATGAYQGPLVPDPRLHAIEAEPVWRDRHDGPSAVVTETAVVYLREGRLVATEFASGWQQWSYGSGLTGPFRRFADMVVVADEGRVTALDATDGSERWSATVADRPVRFLAESGSRLIAGSGVGAYQALELATGRPSHAFNVPSVSELAYSDQELVIFRSHHGEPGVAWFHAHSATSGAELWRGRGWRSLLAVAEGRVYFLNLPAAGSGARFSVSVVDAQRGTRLDHWQYEFGEQRAEWHASTDNAVRLTPDALFATDPAGQQVYVFPHGGAALPTASYGVPGATFLTGPHLGLLFFEGVDHTLEAVALADGSTVNYLFAGARISRLDLNGTRAYVGRTDGTLLAVDLTNARLRYLVHTDGLGFGPTLAAGEYVVVQGATELLALEDLE